ncbi:hypothetical protein YC2023_067198 [Brassica napus]
MNNIMRRDCSNVKCPGSLVHDRCISRPGLEDKNKIKYLLIEILWFHAHNIHLEPQLSPWRLKKPKDGFELPPSPPSLPIIGHLHLLLSGSTHKALQKLSSRYGPLFHLNIFSVPVIFVSSASVAYEIFREHDVNFSFRGTPPIDESLLVGSFGFFTAPYGDYWKFMKKIMKPKDSSDLPPSPPSMPIIGHLHLLLSSLIHKSFQKISSNYGPLLHLRIFNVPIVLVSSASVANEIFKSHDVNISSRGLPPIDESLFFGSSGFFSAPHGDYWKFMKKLVVANVLGPQAIERSRTIRAEELEMFYFDLLEKAMKKETVEIRREAMKFTNNSTCKMIIGRRCGEENGEGERVRGLITESIALTKKVLFATLLRKPLEKLGIPLFNKEIMDISSRYNEVLESFLVEHETKLEKHHQGKDLMDVLLEAKEDENAEYKITRDHIKSLFVELFLGGTDTSKQTIQWTMARIINNPKVIERLREEMDSVVGKSRLIQETDLPNLPYLQAIVKEGLRMYPPVPLFGRRLQEGCKMGGFYVAEKTTLVVNGYAIMRDPHYWDDPDEFKPERFLGEQGDEIREQVLKYLSFGSGRRGCPGSNLAYIFLGTAIGMMVQCFDWRIEEVKVNLEETLSGMVLTMAHPLKCIPVPRICSFPLNNIMRRDCSNVKCPGSLVHDRCISRPGLEDKNKIKCLLNEILWFHAHNIHLEPQLSPWRLKKPKDGFELPPSPPSLPIIGHLHLLLSGSTHKALQKLSSRYGPLFHLNIFSVPVIFVSSASVAYEIFREHDVNFSFRGTPPIDESLLVGSFGFFTAPYGDYWKFMKKIMVTKLLGPQALERSRGIRDYERERLYASLLDKAVRNESVEIGKEAMKFDEVLERILEEHEKKKDDDQDMDLVDVLLETCRDETAEYRITRNHIKSLFVDLVIAGSDTSRHATQWTMAEIINNPKVLERLREEIGSVVGETRLVQETDLQNLPYLQATVKEGLRLHPPGALFARSSREGCKIRGFYVPENTPLVVNAYAVMRDPDSWENPNEFKPERFLGFPCSRQQDERDHALKYIPFGSGRRGCPGSNLAYIIVGTAIGVMVQCFDWKIKAD